MRGKIVLAGLILGLSGVAASAQKCRQPFPNDVYCSGIVTTEAVPRDNYLIYGRRVRIPRSFSTRTTSSLSAKVRRKA